MKNLFDKQYEILERQYNKAEYICPGTGWELKVGAPYPPLDRYLEEHGHSALCIITSDNPESEIRTPEANSSSFGQLVREISEEGYHFLFGVNRDPVGFFPEERTLWVFDMSSISGIEYGRRYGQNAIISYTSAEFGKLIWCI